MDVEAGGTIKGTVTLKGAVPALKVYNLITFPDPEYCGRISDGKEWRLLKDFAVNDRHQIQGVVMVVESPYFTFTSEAGTYEISGIPPGTYRLRAWHPSVKQEQIQMVIVEPSKTIQVDFPLRSPTRRWTAHTRLKPPRFTAAVLGRPINIEPLVERQRP